MPAFPALDDMSTEVKVEFGRELARQFVPLSSGPRLTILFALWRHGEMTAEELGLKLNDRVSDVIRRLMLLKRDGIVQQRRTNQQQIYYSLTSEMAGQLVQQLRQFTERTPPGDRGPD